MFNNAFSQRKTILLPLIIVGLMLLFLFVIFLGLFSSRNNDQATSPTPTPVRSVDRLPTSQRISVLQKSAINQTTQQELEQTQDIEKKTIQPDGTVTNLFASPLISRKNMVITHDGKAVFERILTPERSRDPGYARISDYTKRFGQPQQTIRGSRYYGELISTFIYANKGVTLIGNPRTDEVFEIQIYAPTTVEAYRQQYGQDIEEHEGPVL